MLIEPTFSFATTYCFGADEVQLPTASSDDIPVPGTWKLNNEPVSSIATDAAGTFTYVFYPTPSEYGTYTVSVTVTILPEIIISGTVTNVDCYGKNTGAIDVTVQGGTPSYSYMWNTQRTDEDLTSLTAGTYSVVVTDNHSLHCTATKDFTVNQPDTLTASIAGTNVKCYGESTGAADLTVEGGTSPYTYLWNDEQGSTTEDLNYIPASTTAYKVTVTDDNGCTAEAEVTITQPAAALTITGTTTTPVSCHANQGTTDDGTVTIAVAGGTSPYMYAKTDNPDYYGQSNTLTGFAAATATVYVMDANGCKTNTTVTVAEPANAISFNNPLTTPASCNPANEGTTTDGKIAIDATGGTGTLTYMLYKGDVEMPNNPWINGEFQNLMAGTYEVKVTDENGCYIFQNNITVGSPDAVRITTATPTNVSCAANNMGNHTDGTVTLVATGGSGSYVYSADGGRYQTSNVLTGLSVTAKQYVYVKDDKGCVAKDSVEIDHNPYMEASVTVTDATCNGGKGSVKATATGGTPDYSYAWSNQATTQEVPNLLAGQYTVTVTDANGCQYVADGTIEQPNALQLSMGNPKAVTCNGDEDGQIPFTVSGGTAPYTLAYGNETMTLDAEGDSIVKNLTAGTYNFTLTDANTCETEVNGLQVTQPTALTATLDNPMHVTCKNGDNGVLPVNVSGGVAPYTIAWGGPNDIYVMQSPGNYPIPHLTAGTYTVTVTDVKGCEKILDPQQITEPTEGIAISSMVATNVSCNIANEGQHADGTITVTVTGNNGTVSYSLDGTNFDTDNVLGSLPKGKYGVTVKDENGCTVTDSVEVGEPVAMTINTVSVTPVSCKGSGNADGVVEVTDYAGNQGDATFAISGNNFENNVKFENLDAGQYILKMKDTKGCIATQTVTVEEPAAMTITATGNNVSCHTSNEGNHADGSISVTVQNGTAPYTYSKDGQTYGDSVSMITNLAVGTYNIYVKDANGCTASKNSVVVNQPAAFTITSATPTNVTTNGGNDGQIAVVAAGAVKYTVADHDYTTSPITGLTAGNYTVVAENANGCKASKPVTIGEPTELTMTVNSTNLTCKGNQSGTITVTAEGGVAPLTYSIDGTNYQNENTFNGLSANSYTVYVKDANGSVKSEPITITEPDEDLTLTAGTTTKVSCKDGNNGTVVMTVAGGTAPYTLTYNNQNMTLVAGDNTVENLTAGTYTMNLADANSCTATANVTIEEIDELVITPGTVTDVTCNGATTGKIPVVVAGGTEGYTIEWNGGSYTLTAAGEYTITDLAAGNYTITVTDNNGCPAQTESIRVSEPQALSMMVGVVGNIACFGETNGYVPVIANGGTLPYTVMAALGTDTTKITMDAAGRDTVKNLKAGDYTIIVKDANGCEVNATATVTEPAQLTITNTEITAPSCNAANATTESGLLNNGKIVVTATGGTGAITYSIDGTNYQASNVLNTLTAGTYTVYVKDANGCPAQMDNVEIAAPVAMTASVINVVNVKCKGALTGSAEVTVENGKSPYTYSWNSNPEQHTAVASTLKAGDYTVVVTDDLGCTVTATQTIEEPANAMTADIASTDVKCYGESTGSITVSNVANAVGTVSYTWTNSISTTDAATNVAAGTYSVTLTDANGCTLIKTATVDQPGAALTVSITVPTGAALNACTQTVVANVDGGTGTMVYAWGDDASGSNASATVTGSGSHTVSITVTDGNQCTATDSKTYTAAQPELVMTTCGSSTIPAASDVISAVNDLLDGCGTLSASATVPAAGLTFLANDTTIEVQDGATTYNVKIQKNMPNVTLTASATSVCTGESVTLTATEIAGATYTWTPNVGNTNEVVVTPTATQNYRVVVAVGACSKNANVTVTYNATPAISDITKEICTGNNLTATPAGTVPTGTKYTWTILSNTGVTGATAQNNQSALSFGTLTNTTTASQTVVYNVVPTNGACDGDAFTVTATVKPSIVNDADLVFNAPTIEHTLFYGACDTLVNIVTPDFTTSIAEYDGLLTLANNKSTSNSGAILGRVVPGDNTIVWTLTDPCGNTRTFTQHIVVKYPECGTATDADGNVYQSVRIGCECWTTTNLKSTTYASNLGGGEIPVANGYVCSEYPDENANIENFGRLYSWYSAMKVPEGDDNTTPSTQTDPVSGYTYVQGVCPNGWAVPTNVQYQNMANSIANFSDVKSDDASKWLPGAQGTNGSQFGAVASGYYDPTTDQYYNLLGEAYYWSSEPTTTITKGKCSYITHTCPMLLNTEQDKGMDFSVRCVQRAQ